MFDSLTDLPFRARQCPGRCTAPQSVAAGARSCRHVSSSYADAVRTDMIVALVIAGASAVDWPSLAVGAAGVVLAVAALVWQAVTFRLTGVRVAAHLRIGTLGSNGIISHRAASDWPKRLQELQQLHRGTPVLVLEAFNVGRQAVGMESVAAVTTIGKIRYSPLGFPGNPRPGASLEAGHQTMWYVELAQVQAGIDAWAAVEPNDNHAGKLWMELALGNATTVKTRERITVVPKA